MFVIQGIRKARIKKKSEHARQACENCGSRDFTIKVYRNYFHLFFIPVFPYGNKTAEIYCRGCNQNIQNNLRKHYENTSQTPLYLYAGIILLSVLIILFVKWKLDINKENAILAENPKTGDVYLIREESILKKTYYFLKISRIHGDTIFTYHNNKTYSHFTGKLDESDYFLKNEELIFTKEEIKIMTKNSEICSVIRNYEENTGFNRLK